ncbi:heterokaryon incompatibility protein-domain-containing protein [Coniochaeta sp. 2T2.1]|nr:heterokaryon incompatibility protein-domain-containing protein [Coniochaeta sp. 2T2.1]
MCQDMSCKAELQSNDEQAYPYRQLKGADIRYVILKPFNKDTDLVECSIWQKPLTEAHYVAISYAWGDPHVTDTILVANQRFPVTKNLAACLKRLAIRQAAKDPAEGDASLNIWVDAICINQNDVVERNAQVLRMKDIFPHAEKLIIWLGEEGPHTGLAVERINDVTQLLETLQRNEDGSGFHESRKKLPEHIYVRTTDEYEMQIRSAVMDIYLREWWDRTWILQELGLSKDVEVHCGAYEMTWNALESFHKFSGFLLMEDPELLFETAGDKGMHMIDIKELPLAVLNLRDDIEDSYESSLHKLLDSTKTNKATDPRDKIYGILGLSSDFRSGGIDPQYEHPVQQVYFDVVKAYFAKYDALDILDQCFYGHTAEIGLPSWIPNWALADVYIILPEIIPKYLTNEGEEPRQAFDTCGGLSLSSRPWFFGDDDSLHLTGACFDTIASVTDVPDFLHGWTLESLLGSWLPTVPTPDERYPFASGTWLDAFRRTLVMDTRFLPTERDFSMVFPTDPGSKDKAAFLDRLSEARPAFLKACMLKRLAYTSKGLMGLVRPEVRVGDSLAVLVGSKVPQCLREVTPIPAQGKPRYQLIGEAYFHGIMDGEAMDGLKLDEIILV